MAAAKDSAVQAVAPLSITQPSTPSCPLSLCGALRLLRSALAARSPRAAPGAADEAEPLHAKLDRLAAKVDSLADRLALSGASDSRSALKALEEAQCNGLEVARYSQMPQFDASILDTYIPRCRRLTQLHFGQIVSNPHAPMAFKEKVGYNMTYNLVPPGNGNALHMHRSIEIFVALDGRWEIAWGMKGEHSVVLEPWDFVACPARVCHSYKNIDSDVAHNIMTILPGKSWITWAPDVVAEARKHGAECDDNGMLLKYAHLVASVATKGLADSSDAVEWKSMGPRDMDPFVHRFSERRPLECQMGEETAEAKAPYIEMFWKTVGPESVFELPRKSGVDLLLVVLDGNVLVRTGVSRPLAAAGRLDAIRVPAEALAAGDVVVSNPCPTDCTLLVVATEMREQNDLYFHLC